MKRHREAGKVEAEADSLEELDFEYRQLREFNNRILQEMDAVVKAHPEIGPQVQMMYDRSGIKPGNSGVPSVASSRVGSVAGGGVSAGGVMNEGH